MTNEDFIDELWNLAKPKDAKGLWKANYWPIIRTDRGDLERAWNTTMKGKTEEEKLETLNKIELSLPELAKMRAGEKKAGNMPQPVGVGRFIRIKRWIGCMDSVSESERIEKQAENRCAEPGCQNETMGSRFLVCQQHFQFSANKRLRSTYNGAVKQRIWQNLVDVLREHYAAHPEIHELRGQAALKFIRYRIGEIGK